MTLNNLEPDTKINADISNRYEDFVSSHKALVARANGSCVEVPLDVLDEFINNGYGDNLHSLFDIQEYSKEYGLYKK